VALAAPLDAGDDVDLFQVLPFDGEILPGQGAAQAQAMPRSRVAWQTRPRRWCVSTTTSRVGIQPSTFPPVYVRERSVSVSIVCGVH